jgi:hypothetical protein
VYLIVTDNHGKEIRRFHHTDMAHWEVLGEKLPEQLKRAVTEARESDVLLADDEMRDYGDLH